MMKPQLLLLLALSAAPFQASAESWFTDTPLQASYSALVEGHDELAWQELVQALSTHDPDESLWLPVKQTLQESAQCHLAPEEQPGEIRVTLMRKTSPTRQEYQVRLSVDMARKPFTIRLKSSGDRTVAEGRVSSNGWYEFESRELLTPPEPGLYTLQIDDASYPLLISSFDQQNWLSFGHGQKIRLNVPLASPGCAEATAHWQWFDDDYEMIGPMEPITNPQFPASPPGAKRLSAVVELAEYQSGVRIEYQQRLTTPLLRASQ